MPSTSSITGRKYASERIVPKGAASAGRIRRRAAASTNAFSITLAQTPRWWSCAASTRSGRRTVPIVPGVWRYASRIWRIYSSWLRPSSIMMPSTLQIAQRRTVDRYRVAVVSQTAEQRLHHRPAAQKVRPLVIDEIRSDDGGMLAVALLHQLEEDVRLLRFQIQIPELVDQKDVQSRQALEQPPRGSIRQRGVHLVEQVLGLDELTTVTILQRLQQQPTS